MGGADGVPLVLPLQVIDHQSEKVLCHLYRLFKFPMVKEFLDLSGPPVAVECWQGASVKNIYKYIDLGS